MRDYFINALARSGTYDSDSPSHSQKPLEQVAHRKNDPAIVAIHRL